MAMRMPWPARVIFQQQAGLDLRDEAQAEFVGNGAEEPGFVDDAGGEQLHREMRARGPRPPGHRLGKLARQRKARQHRSPRTDYPGLRVCVGRGGGPPRRGHLRGRPIGRRAGFREPWRRGRRPAVMMPRQRHGSPSKEEGREWCRGAG
ncbi:MAG TPA: hypothetical protein PL183_12025 [Aquamicrobium sp.]|nr:hypothetical protein [Aquamicrobium sp.]